MHTTQLSGFSKLNFFRIPKQRECTLEKQKPTNIRKSSKYQNQKANTLPICVHTAQCPKNEKFGKHCRTNTLPICVHTAQ